MRIFCRRVGSSRKFYYTKVLIEITAETNERPASNWPAHGGNEWINKINIAIPLKYELKQMTTGNH